MSESPSTPRDRVFLAAQRLRIAEDINREEGGIISPARLGQLRSDLEKARRDLADEDGPDGAA